MVSNTHQSVTTLNYMIQTSNLDVTSVTKGAIMTKQITTLGSVSLAVKAVVGTAGLVGTVVRKSGDMALETEVGKALHNDAYGELIKGEGTSQELIVDKVVSLVSSEKEVKEPKV